MKEAKIIKSIYLDEKTAKKIEAEAKKQRRNFSFIASEILNAWAKKSKTNI